MFFLDKAGKKIQFIVFFITILSFNSGYSLEKEYSCYWMENISGKFEWVIADVIYNEELSKKQCFNLDSCNGGKGFSGGGCYKWAKSSNDKASSW